MPFFSNAQVDVPVRWEGMFQVGGHVIELHIQVQGSMVSYAMIKKKTADFLWLTSNSKQGKHDFIDDIGFSEKNHFRYAHWYLVVSSPEVR